MWCGRKWDRYESSCVIWWGVTMKTRNGERVKEWAGKAQGNKATGNRKEVSKNVKKMN
jgi:hypothetical protein